MNFLEHDSVSHLRGGFFLNFGYENIIDAPVDNQLTAWTAKYDYGIVDGVLALTSAAAYGLAQGEQSTLLYDSLALSLTSCDYMAAYNAGLIHASSLPTIIAHSDKCADLPSEFAKEAKAQQTRDIGIAPGCDPNVVNPCDSVTTAVSLAIPDGMKVMETLGLETWDNKSADASRMVHAMTQRVNPQDDTSPLKDWSCVPDEAPKTGHHCAFTVPAKRLNVYPDSVELVWFDGKELDNAAYAIYVMAHHNTSENPASGQPEFDQSTVDKLCSAGVPILEQRWFDKSELGASDEWIAFNPAVGEYGTPLASSICADKGIDDSALNDCSVANPGASPSGGVGTVPLLGVLLAFARRRGQAGRRNSRRGA